MPITYSTAGINSLDILLRDMLVSYRRDNEMSQAIIDESYRWINDHYQPKEGPLELSGGAELVGEGTMG